MPNIKIDGIEIDVSAGTTIIEAAKQAGIFIPHYCYHPGLSIAGNCRMCLVEVEKVPKLQISCYTAVTEGMVVHTTSSKVKEAQQAVLEFLLVNHPLDCPVCDQSGECELQNYYMKYGLYDSRLAEDKVKKPKAVPIGPAVMLDAERCVLCSRCVRFCDEVTKTHELGIVNRGDHAEITVAPGVELNNKYSGNVVDICPVGALTDRDFRFKCRVWFLASTPSVCPGCSRGCNIEVHWNKDRPYQTPGERVMRLKPRFNPDVNQWWICDEGRYGYRFIDQDRVLHPMKRQDGAWIWTSWSEALDAVSATLSGAGGLGVIVSTDMTNEDLWLAKTLFVRHLGITSIAYQNTKKPGYHDEFLIQADKSPNTRGAVELGFEARSGDVLSGVLEGKIATLILFGHNLIDLYGAEFARAVTAKVKNLIVLASNRHQGLDAAGWVLPSAVYAEKSGTFINVGGRVQRLFNAFSPLGDARPEWEILRDLGAKLGLKMTETTSSQIFSRLAAACPAFEGMSYEMLGKQGAKIKAESR